MAERKGGCALYFRLALRHVPHVLLPVASLTGTLGETVGMKTSLKRRA